MPLKDNEGLVVMTVAELGFPRGTEYADFAERLEELKLEFRPVAFDQQMLLLRRSQPESAATQISEFEKTLGRDRATSDLYVFDSGGDHGIMVTDRFLMEPETQLPAEMKFVLVTREKKGQGPKPWLN